MAESKFTRQITSITDLKAVLNTPNRAVPFLKRIYDSLILNGTAFLAFRNKEATIYYAGNQLCNLVEKEAYFPTVYDRYLPLIRSKVLTTKKAKSITEAEWLTDAGISRKTLLDVLPEILDNIEKDKAPESFQASRFYYFSPLAAGRDHNIVLLDVEAAFATENERERIDLVFYNKNEQRLMFIEVKRLYDNRWNHKTVIDNNGKKSYTVDTREVLDQMEKYRDRLKTESGKIIEQYNRVISYYNELSGSNMPPIVDDSYVLGLLLVEFTSSKEDRERVKIIRGAFKQKGFNVSAIGDTKSLTANKSDLSAPDRSLDKIYNNLKK